MMTTGLLDFQRREEWEEGGGWGARRGLPRQAYWMSTKCLVATGRPTRLIKDSCADVLDIVPPVQPRPGKGSRVSTPCFTAHLPLLLLLLLDGGSVHAILVLFISGLWVRGP